MLQHLIIKNYALIQFLELSPDSSLNIITGETGAGKSIILGAIGLLLGNRMDGKALYNSEEKCLIEGHFDVSKLGINNIFDIEELDYEPITIIRREINTLGKSRAFINDTPVNLETLKRIGDLLLDVHSQNDTLALASNDYQLQIIDTYAQNQHEIAAFNTEFSNYAKQRSALNHILDKAKIYKKDFDFNNFVYDELIKAKLVKGELEKIETELNMLENAELLKTKLLTIAEYLYNAENSSIDYLEEAHAQMGSISNFSPIYLSLKGRILSSLIELKDVFRETELALKNIEYDQENIVKLRERLDNLNNLCKKHQVKDDTELLEMQAHLKMKVEAVQNLEEDIENAQKNEKAAKQKMEIAAGNLSKTRLKVLPEIEQKITGLLTELGIPNGSLIIDHCFEEVGNSGIDKINLLFSANKGIAPQTLRNVASGGEFSRLMLAIKYILANKRSLPTIIFDEIDTGVSGEISIKVGKILREMANLHQIIAITHLHQIAAQGNRHYFVYKDDTSERTNSKIKQLSKNDRITEIAQMIGGDAPSAGIIENAKAILESYETI